MSYKKLSSIYIDYEYIDCDIQLEKGALLLNKSNNGVVAQLRFCNYSEEILESLYISIEQYDDTDKLLDDGKQVEFAYLDLYIGKNNTFGDSKAIVMNNNKTRKIKVHINKYKLKSRVIDIKEENIFQYGRYLIDLEEIPFDDSIIFDNNNVDLITDLKKTNYPLALGDNWFCSCGKFNYHNNSCIRCGLGKDLQFNRITKNTVKDACHNEEEKAYKKKMIKLKKIRKTIIIMCIVATLAVIIVCGCAIIKTVIIPSAEYSKAELLIKDGKYEEAINIYERLDDYKDSKDQLKESKFQYAKQLAEEGYYQEAKIIFGGLNNYKNSDIEAKKLSNTTSRKNIELVVGYDYSEDMPYTKSRKLTKTVSATVNGKLSNSNILNDNDEVKVMFKAPIWTNSGWRDINFKYEGKYADVKDGYINGEGKMYATLGERSGMSESTYVLIYSGTFKDSLYSGKGAIYNYGTNENNEIAISGNFEEGNIFGLYSSKGKVEADGNVDKDGVCTMLSGKVIDYASITSNRVE
jgi:tetratricopeptide (TPR) repeat protein